MFHLLLKILLRVDLILQGSDGVHECLLDPPICSLWALDSLVVLVQVLNSKLQELMEILWLGLLFLALLVLADVTQQILNTVFRLEEGLREVILVPNELDGVIVEGLDVPLSNIHDWHDSVEQDVLHEWLQLLHGAVLLGAQAHELDTKTECFVSNEACFATKELLEVRLHQWNRVLQVEVV